jgi:hypothetical protein
MKRNQPIKTKDDVKSISLKNIRVHNDMSEETTCFSASVYVNGVKAGTAKNDGRGGCNMYYLERDVGEKALFDWAEQETGESFESLDWYLYQLIDKWEESKTYKRWCKKQLVFKLEGDAKDDWRTLNAPYSEHTKKFIVDKYGDKVAEILNERFVKA